MLSRAFTTACTVFILTQMNPVGSKVFRRWCIILRIIAFKDFVHPLEFKIIKKHNISETGSISIFRWGEGRTYCVGPSEVRNRPNFRNVTFSSYLEFRTMDKLHKPISSEIILSISYHLISIGSICLLSSHVYLGLLTGLSPPGFPTRILYAFIFCPIRAKFCAQFILLGWMILVTCGEFYKLWCSLCNCHQLYIILTFSGTDTLLSIKITNTFNLWSSLNARDQVSHPYKTKDKL
jgi:hypothetical protein